MRKKRKTFLSEIWDSVILTQSVLQWEFVVWYVYRKSPILICPVTFKSLSQILETASLRKTTFRLFSSCNLSPSVYSNVSPTDSYRNLITLLSRQIHQLGTPVNDFHPQPNITQFDRGQFYYIKEYSYCMPGSNHVYCILGSLKREISLEFETYISQWHCRIQVIWSALDQHVYNIERD